MCCHLPDKRQLDAVVEDKIHQWCKRGIAQCTFRLCTVLGGIQGRSMEYLKTPHPALWHQEQGSGIAEKLFWTSTT